MFVSYLRVGSVAPLSASRILCGAVPPCDWQAGRLQECDRLGDFQGVRDFLEYKSLGSSRTGALAMALINSEQELAREHTRFGRTDFSSAR